MITIVINIISDLTKFISNLNTTITGLITAFFYWISNTCYLKPISTVLKKKLTKNRLIQQGFIDAPLAKKIFSQKITLSCTKRYTKPKKSTSVKYATCSFQWRHISLIINCCTAMSSNINAKFATISLNSLVLWITTYKVTH